MSKSPYNPEKHHRRSIRLKGHDYAGGGLYFVTICAHREFIAAAGGAPFGGTRATQARQRMTQARQRATQARQRATQASPIRDLLEERMHITAEKSPFMQWGEYAIMPDHFHALVRLDGGHLSLGDLIGGFKAAVSRELRRRIRTGGINLALPEGMRIWHRNYYEMIVRTSEAEEKITEYIRMNPWRCVQNFGNGLRGMGNPALWNAEKQGLLCSRNAPRPKTIPKAAAYFSGFHSPMETEIFDKLLEHQRNIIHCPAWGLDGKPNKETLQALEGNRMLILEMRNRDGDLAAAEQRNQFVLQNADRLWLPHINPGGMLDRLVREASMSSPNFEDKILNREF